MRLRFHTAREVFSAFPTLGDDCLAEPADAPPLPFCETLLNSPTPEDAVSFFAYLAPKREAVWWALRCIKRLAVPLGDAASLAAAERWVREPEEVNRRAALVLAEAGNSGAAETWAAYGAGWAGGNISPDGLPAVAAAPHLTAKAVRAAVLIAVAEGAAKDRRERLSTCHGEAMRVASDDIDSHVG